MDLETLRLEADKLGYRLSRKPAPKEVEETAAVDSEEDGTRRKRAPKVGVFIVDGDFQRRTPYKKEDENFVTDKAIDIKALVRMGLLTE
jgi:hypothetical protein